MVPVPEILFSLLGLPLIYPIFTHVDPDPDPQSFWIRILFWPGSTNWFLQMEPEPLLFGFGSSSSLKRDAVVYLTLFVCWTDAWFLAD